MMSFHAGDRGFTLLEVTLALAILAAAFTSLSSLQARNLMLTAENQTITQATLAARDMIARFRSGALPLEDDEDEIEEDSGWKWQLRVEETELEGLLRAELSIFQEQQGPEEGHIFVFFKQQETQ